MIQYIGDVLILITAGLGVACVVAYQVTTDGAWRLSEVGRHLMAFMGSLAAALSLSVLKAVVVDVLGHDDPVWFQVIRVLVFCTVPVVLAQRLHIIISTRDRSPTMTSSTRSVLKTLVFVLSALVGTFFLDMRDGHITGAEAASLVVLAGGSLAVALKSNTVENPSIRAVIALFTVTMDAIVSGFSDSQITAEEWASVAMAFLGALQLSLAGNDNATLSTQGTPAPVFRNGPGA
jgi:hypothetical protein